MNNAQSVQPGPKTIKTKNYEMFEPFEFNRDVRKTKQLIRSMQKNGFDEGSALNCRRTKNGKLKIVQGHHRFEVAKALDLPIVAIISESEAPVWDLELGTHPWNTIDYVTGFAREGREQYQEIIKFHKKTGISTTTAISLLRGGTASGTYYTEAAKQGEFEVNHRSFANRVAAIVEHLKEQGYKFATNQHFVKAIAKCVNIPGWSDDRWMSKAEAHRALLDNQPTVNHCLDMIENVYNRNCKKDDKLPVAFEAKKISQKKMGFKK